MSRKRVVVAIGAALLLAAAGLVGLRGATVLAQEVQELGLIVYTSDRTGDYEIYVLDPSTGLSTQLTSSPTDDIEPQWSPDGTKIAFISDRDGDYELFMMNADGTEVEQLTFNNAEDRLPHWQPPDGAYIVYHSNVNGNWDMYALSLADGVVRQLTNDAADERGPVAAAAEDAGTGTTDQSGQTAAPTGSSAGQANAVVNSTTLNVRANPGTGAQIVVSLKSGDEMTVLGQYYAAAYMETWLQIRTADGTEGWVYEPLLTLNIALADVPSVSATYSAPQPTATPLPAATAVPSFPAVSIEFWSDRTHINSGDCVILNWRVAGIQAVYFEETGVVGESSIYQCLTEEKTYTLRVVLTDGSYVYRYITIYVDED